MPGRSLLAVYGSPRKGGNTSILLDWFLEGFAEAGAGPIEKVHLGGLAFSACSECGRCRRTGVCPVRDDMTRYYDALLSCDRIAIAIPVFFLGPPAVAKAFIDRAQALWVRKYALGIGPKAGREAGERKGFLLSVSGYEGSEKIFRCNRAIVRAFFMSCGVEYAGEIVVPGVDGFGELRTVAGIAERAREAGRSFAL